MSFIKSLFGKKEPQFNHIGNVDSICPYCNQALEKRPSRKTKCPHCGNDIYARTRPSDQKKVLVTEAQAQEIDEQWMKKNGTYDAYLEEQAEFQRTKAELTKLFGHEASDRDVYWAIYNQKSIDHAQAMNWGLYRNTRFDMGELLRKENNNAQALNMFIEVSYLDANGPANRGGISSNPQLLKKYPPFDREMAVQAPGVVDRIEKLAKLLDLSDAALKKRYLEIAGEIQQLLDLSISPEKAWQDYRKELEKSRK